MSDPDLKTLKSPLRSKSCHMPSRWSCTQNVGRGATSQRGRRGRSTSHSTSTSTARVSPRPGPTDRPTASSSSSGSGSSQATHRQGRTDGRRSGSGSEREGARPGWLAERSDLRFRRAAGGAVCRAVLRPPPGRRVAQPLAAGRPSVPARTRSFPAPSLRANGIHAIHRNYKRYPMMV